MSIIHVGSGDSFIFKIKTERGDTMVELDQFKTTLNTYKEPLVEVRDSL